MKVSATIAVVASLCGLAFSAPASDGLTARTEQSGIVERQALADGEEKRFIIDVPTIGCPPGQRRDHFGKCRVIFEFGERDVSADAGENHEDKRFIIDVPTIGCPPGQRRDHFGKCRVIFEFGERDLSADAGENSEDKRFIIDVPTIGCPMGQRRDHFGKCRPIFQFGEREISANADEKREDKRYLYQGPHLNTPTPTTPTLPCLPGYRRNRNGFCQRISTWGTRDVPAHAGEKRKENRDVISAPSNCPSGYLLDYRGICQKIF